MISFKNIIHSFVIACMFSANLSLAQATDSKLEEVTVTASRVEMPLRQVGASVSVLTAEDLEQKNFPLLADALRTLPSVDVGQSGGLGKSTSVRVRGEEAHRTLLLIDGINVSDVSGVQAMPHFGHLLNSQLGRVEVLRGPQGMMYGADAGGVVSVFSKQSDQAFEGDLGAEAGRYDTYRVNGNVRGTVDRLKYSLTASALDSNGFNARADDVSEDDDGYENVTLHGTASLALTENSGLGLVLRNTDGLSEFDAFDSPDAEEDYQQRSGKLDWHYNTGTQSHEFAYLRTNTDRDYITWYHVEDSESSNFEYDYAGKLEQWQYFGQYAVADDLNFVFGADHRTDSYTSTFDAETFERDQSGVYGEGQVSYGDNFFYTIGLRYDDNEDFGEHVSYRLTAAYLLPIDTGELKLKGSYGTGFRAPSLFEIGYNRGPFAPDFLPDNLIEETSVGYEVGAEWLFASNTFIELVWFDNRIEDEIFWFDLIENGMWMGGGYMQSDGETTSKGVEFNASVEVIDNLVFAGNYTYNDTALSDDTTVAGAEPGGPRPRRPKHLYNLSVAYAFWQDRINLAAFYRNSRDAVEYMGAQRVALDDFDVLDITGSWAVNDALEVYLRWENALDEDYQEVGGYNTAGSAGYAGVRLRF